MIDLLVIEDESAIRDMIRFALPTQEFTMREAADTPEADQQLANKRPDILILDWMLPSKSGIEFIKSLRKDPVYSDIPVLMLTAKAEEEHKIRGLEAGADDYITKPFSPRELFTRIKTILRRGRFVASQTEFVVGGLRLNTATHHVYIHSNLLTLTPNEYRLLLFFIQHPRRTYTRDQLISLVWGHTHYIDERTVDGQVRRLRDRLKPFQYHHLIKTVRGAGYQFTGDAT